MKKITSLILIVIMSLLSFIGCAFVPPVVTNSPNPPVVTSSPNPPDETSLPNVDSKVSIKLTFNSEELIVDMYDNNSATDFLSLLPLTLNFDDFNPSEKMAPLPNGRRLDISDAPDGFGSSAGELGYYSPMGNMVIYHRDFSYYSGIVPIGRFRSGVEKVAAISGAVSVKFELVNENNNGNSTESTQKPTSPSNPSNPVLPTTPTPPSNPVPPTTPTPPIVPEIPREITKMKVIINETVLNAELFDTATAKAFARMLPLTITMSELNGNEKFNYLSSNLPTSASIQGKLNEGDLMLFGSNCFVLFYETFSSSYSYSRIGKILNTSELASAVGRGSVTITFVADN